VARFAGSAKNAETSEFSMDEKVGYQKALIDIVNFLSDEVDVVNDRYNAILKLLEKIKGKLSEIKDEAVKRHRPVDRFIRQRPVD